MAKFYNKKTNEIIWSDTDIACAVEEAYFELTDYLALKHLDGHDRHDQWYMLMHVKLNELMDAMDRCPINELDEDVKPLF